MDQIAAHTFIYIVIHNGMESIKLLACQAKSISTYKNTQTKPLKCCANIYFNKQCLKFEF
jgi:hypothetical protein